MRAIVVDRWMQPSELKVALAPEPRLAPPSSYHVDRLRQMPIGYFYDVMTNGFGAMSDYSAQVTPGDRWAIAAYVRTLQYSQYAPAADVPADKHPELDRSLAAAPAPAPEHH